MVHQLKTKSSKDSHKIKKSSSEKSITNSRSSTPTSISQAKDYLDAKKDRTKDKLNKSNSSNSSSNSHQSRSLLLKDDKLNKNNNKTDLPFNTSLSIRKSSPNTSSKHDADKKKQTINKYHSNLAKSSNLSSSSLNSIENSKLIKKQ